MSGRWLILFACCCPCAWHGSVGIGLALLGRVGLVSCS
jgi:hypothetical protein